MLLLHLVYHLAQTKTVIRQFLCFPCGFPFSTFTWRYHVNFITDKMNSFSEFLSSPLLDFVPSDNNEQSDELDMLLETLPESDIQLLNSRVRDDKHQLDHNITNDSVANASDIFCHGTCSGNTNDHTSSTSSFVATTETDLKQLKDKNKSKNTMKSTIKWINRFETWQKVRGIANELDFCNGTLLEGERTRM